MPDRRRPPLPHILNEIADAAGVEAALTLAAARGGQRVYLPSARRLRGGHWLAQLLGLDAAQRIVAHFQIEQGRRGVELVIPFGPSAGRQRQQQLAREARIRAALMAGHSMAEIARSEGLSRRTITAHAARLREREGLEPPPKAPRARPAAAPAAPVPEALPRQLRLLD